MKSKKIVILLTSIVTLLVTSISATIAWYASSNTGGVSTVELRMKSEKNLYISTSASGTRMSEVTMGDGEDNLHEISFFEPVSSMHSDSWLENESETPLFCKNYYSIIPEDGIPTPLIADQGYFQQDLYISADTNVVISIDPEKTHFLPNIQKNELVVDDMYEFFHGEVSKEEILENLNSLVKSLRISFLVLEPGYYNYYIVDPYKDEGGVTKFGGLLDNLYDGYYDYYTDSDGILREALFGDVANRELIDEECYEASSVDDSSLIGRPNCFNAKTKAGVRHLDVDKAIEKGAVIAEEQSLSLDESDDTVTGLQIPVYRDHPTKIVVSIYIEGWDKDNIIDTMSASFDLDVSFKVLKNLL